MRRLRQAAQALYVVALVGAITYAVVSQRHALVDAVQRLSAGALLGALLADLGGLLLSMLAWRSVLASFGSPLPAPASARIFFVGQLGKYLPGSVWPILTQLQLGKKVGVARARMGTATVVWLAMSVVTGLGAAMLAVPLLLSGGGSGTGYSLLAAGLLAVGAVGLYPGVLNAVLGKALALARRPAMERALDGGDVLRATALLLSSSALFGLQLWLLVRDVATDGSLGLPSATGAYAMAATLGFLAVLAPAGAGVREVVLVLALSPVLAAGQATGVAVVSRVLMTVADLVLGVAALGPRSERVLVESEPETEPDT